MSLCQHFQLELPRRASLAEKTWSGPGLLFAASDETGNSMRAPPPPGTMKPQSQPSQRGRQDQKARGPCLAGSLIPVSRGNFIWAAAPAYATVRHTFSREIPLLLPLPCMAGVLLIRKGDRDMGLEIVRRRDTARTRGVTAAVGLRLVRIVNTCLAMCRVGGFQAYKRCRSPPSESARPCPGRPITLRLGKCAECQLPLWLGLWKRPPLQGPGRGAADSPRRSSCGTGWGPEVHPPPSSPAEDKAAYAAECPSSFTFPGRVVFLRWAPEPQIGCGP